jgi:magnesium transporter
MSRIRETWCGSSYRRATPRSKRCCRRSSVSTRWSWSRRQLPKVVDYGDYLQVVAHGLALEDDEHVSLDLDIIMGSSFVVTHAHGPCSQLDDLRATRLLARGPAWITHTLLDLMVDDCVPFIDGMDGRIAGLEAEVVAHAGKPGGDTLVPKIFALKRQLQVLRRAGVHQREVLLRLGRGDFGQIPSEATPYFRDVYEHFVRVADLAETHREQLSNLLDAYWSVQSHRMNEIMKTLTLMSTIMLPLTFIAGVYGMNFSHMPELSWRYGYPAALALMLAVAGSIFAWFKHRKWF